jgi:hypothetical protein
MNAAGFRGRPEGSDSGRQCAGGRGVFPAQRSPTPKGVVHEPARRFFLQRTNILHIADNLSRRYRFFLVFIWIAQSHHNLTFNFRFGKRQPTGLLPNITDVGASLNLATAHV